MNIGSRDRSIEIVVLPQFPTDVRLVSAEVEAAVKNGEIRGR